jgi:glycerophosphoryl diester phosphodiesterase
MGRRIDLAVLPLAELPARVPRLDDVLNRAKAWPGFVINLEVKEPGTEGPIVDAARRAAPAGRIVLTSFHEEVCGALRDAHAPFPFGLIRERPLAADVARARRLGCSFLVAHRKGLVPALALVSRAAELPLWAWGVNTVREARRSAALGVDAWITDRPRVLLRHAARGPVRP